MVFHKVVGTCNARNMSSAKLMENIGMTKEAVFKEELYWQNEWTDQFFIPFWKGSIYQQSMFEKLIGYPISKLHLTVG